PILMLSCERSCVAVETTWRLKSARMRWTVIQPIARANAHRITNVKSAETPARRSRIGSRSKPAEIRRAARDSQRSGLRTKDVAGSPERVQQARLAVGAELAAQVRDEDLERVGRREGVIPPYLVEQALARDHDALVAHQVLEQLELTLREVDLALAAGHFVRVCVEREVPDAQRRRAARRAPPQQRAHAREQLLALEGLDQVVVGARVQPLHTRLQPVAPVYARLAAAPAKPARPRAAARPRTAADRLDDPGARGRRRPAALEPLAGGS